MNENEIDRRPWFWAANVGDSAPGDMYHRNADYVLDPVGTVQAWFALAATWPIFCCANPGGRIGTTYESFLFHEPEAAAEFQALTAVRKAAGLGTCIYTGKLHDDDTTMAIGNPKTTTFLEELQPYLDAGLTHFAVDAMSVDAPTMQDLVDIYDYMKNLDDPIHVVGEALPVVPDGEGNYALDLDWVSKAPWLCTDAYMIFGDPNRRWRGQRYLEHQVRSAGIGESAGLNYIDSDRHATRKMELHVRYDDNSFPVLQDGLDFIAKARVHGFIVDQLGTARPQINTVIHSQVAGVLSLPHDGGFDGV